MENVQLLIVNYYTKSWLTKHVDNKREKVNKTAILHNGYYHHIRIQRSALVWMLPLQSQVFLKQILHNFQASDNHVSTFNPMPSDTAKRSE